MTTWRERLGDFVWDEFQKEPWDPWDIQHGIKEGQHTWETWLSMAKESAEEGNISLMARVMRAQKDVVDRSTLTCAQLEIEELGTWLWLWERGIS